MVIVIASTMKTSRLLILAAALLGAVSLAAKPAAPSVRLNIDIDRTVLPAGGPQRAIIKIGLDSVRIPRGATRMPLNLALVIDRSSSMGGDKIERAREAALELVGQLAADDIVSLIAYDSDVEVLVPAGPVGNGRALASAIRSLTPRGFTALHGGVSAGAEQIRRYLGETRHVPRIILLSDGQANRGPSSPEELGRLGASLLKEGISVSTIGLGLGFNEDLMARLAERSDGNTYFVENSDDLPRIFAAELGDALSVVARKVTIEVEFPAGVRPLRFVGREGKISGQRAELALNQLYGGQEKFALVEIEVTGARAGVEQSIATAHVRYDDAASQRAEKLSASRSVRFSTDETAVVASANHRVQADFAANVMAVAKDEAIALVDSGRRDEAGRVLRERAQELSAMSKAYGNSAVADVAAPAAAEADRIERDGITNAERKLYRAEAQQVKSQQGSLDNRR